MGYIERHAMVDHTSRTAVEDRDMALRTGELEEFEMKFVFVSAEHSVRRKVTPPDYP